MRDELPQPLVNAAREHKQMLVHLLFSGQQCGTEINKKKSSPFGLMKVCSMPFPTGVAGRDKEA